MFVGVDVAITDFPDAELGPQLRAEQRAAIDDVRKTSLCASLCVREDLDSGGAEVTVWLHNEAAGHAWPSGSTPDRRAWVELIATDDGGEVLYQSGVLGQDQAIEPPTAVQPRQLPRDALEVPVHVHVVVMLVLRLGHPPPLVVLARYRVR